MFVSSFLSQNEAKKEENLQKTRFRPAPICWSKYLDPLCLVTCQICLPLYFCLSVAWSSSFGSSVVLFKLNVPKNCNPLITIKIFVIYLSKHPKVFYEKEYLSYSGIFCRTWGEWIKEWIYRCRILRWGLLTSVEHKELPCHYWFLFWVELFICWTKVSPFGHLVTKIAVSQKGSETCSLLITSYHH